MAKISRGFSTCVAVFGVFSLIFGLALSVFSWLLQSKFSDVKIYSDYNVKDVSVDSSYKSFSAYWWGGLVYCVPAIFGIVGGWTRNVVAMVLYLVFNIICLICSVVVCFFVAIMFAFWFAVNELLQNGLCIDKMFALFGKKSCICVDKGFNSGFAIENASCSDMKVTQVYLLAILGLASLSSLLACIASYVSCCSLCNQESDNNITYVVQSNPQQPVFNLQQTPTQQCMPPSSYYPPPAQQFHTHDKANLTSNEVQQY